MIFNTMKTLFNLLIIILIPFSLGFVLNILINKKKQLPVLFSIALSYGLGTGLLAQIMLLLGILRIPFSSNLINLLLILSTLIISLFAIKYFKHLSFSTNFRLFNKKIDWLSIFFISYISFYLIYVFWRSLNIPIATWDAFSTIAFKSKIIYFEHSIKNLNLLPHRTYPLHIPFLQSWLSMNLGHWDDQLIKVFFPLTCLSYVIIHYYFLKDYTNKRWSLFGCIMLLSSNLFLYHASISYRDFFLTYFNCSTIILILLWQKNSNNSLLFLSSLFAGFATFTKLEGSAFMLIYLFLVALILVTNKSFNFRQKINSFLVFAIPSLIICLNFHIYKFFNRILTDGSGIYNKTNFIFSMERMNLIPNIIIAFSKNLLFSGNWNIIWGILLLCIILFPKSLKKPEIFFTFMSICLFISLYFAIALFSGNYSWIAGENKETGLSRLFLHFYPLSSIFIILITYSNFNKIVELKE